MTEEIRMYGISDHDKQFLNDIDADPTLKLSDKDMLLYNKYLQSRNKYILTELVNSLLPVALKMAAKYQKGTVSDGMFKSMVFQNISYAISSYDPSKGASLSTHVGTCMQRLMRSTSKFANMVNMGEMQTYDFPKLKNAAEQLSSQLGRDPTHQEVADHYNQTLKDLGKFEPSKAWTGEAVEKLFSKDYKDHYESNNPLTTTNNSFDQSNILLNYIEKNLTPDELRLYKLLQAGHSGQEISSELGLDTNGLNYRKKNLVKKIDSLKGKLGTI